MSTTGASTPRPTNAERAAALLAAVSAFYARQTAPRYDVPPQLAWVRKRFPVQYALTEKGRRALAAPKKERAA